jgi:DNA-binding IclR family transcriptional regulator
LASGMSVSEAVRPTTPTCAHAYFVLRTVAALEVLAFAPCRSTELAASLGVHPRTARRLLQQLAAEEWVSYDRHTRRYGLTVRLPTLGIQALVRSLLVKRAVPIVARLAVDLATTADLYVPSYQHVASIVHAGPSGEAHIGIGGLIPNHCTAAGRALLACRSRWRHEVLANPIERHTATTTTDPAQLARVLADVRDRGWAYESGEYREGESSLAAPVLGNDGSAVAALGLTTPAVVGDLELIVHTVMTAAAGLTGAIGERNAVSLAA